MTSENLELLALREQNNQLLMRIERYEQKLRRMAIINEIAESANGTSNPAEAIGNTLTRICQDTGWPAGHAFVVVRRDGEPRLISAKVWHLAERGRYDALVSYTENMELKSGQALPGIVYHDKEALWANAVKSDAKRFGLARRVGLLSQFAFPIMIGDEVIAVLEFFSERNLAPDEIVLDIVAQLGMLLGRVFERRRAADERETLNEKLVATSRRAGMAEVASGVLHNVGNALNSITVSASLLQESLEQCSFAGLTKLAELLRQNQNNLGSFFTEDAKGRKVIAYLDELARQMEKDHSEICREVEAMRGHVQHIKNIVRKQQYYATPTAMREKVNVNDLIDDSLKMNNLHSVNRRIHVERNYGQLPLLELDKHDLIQILNNLIGNARQALDGKTDDAVISISTRVDDERKLVLVDVGDNGCGIDEQYRDRIFQFGFTTREDGHGFGLHTSANTAKQMGGELSFYSLGKDQGAVFTLKLPLSGGSSAKGEIAA